jgi:hypothetical protein
VSYTQYHIAVLISLQQVKFFQKGLALGDMVTWEHYQPETNF